MELSEVILMLDGTKISTIVVTDTSFLKGIQRL